MDFENMPTDEIISIVKNKGYNVIQKSIINNKSTLFKHADSEGRIYVNISLNGDCSPVYTCGNSRMLTLDETKILRDMLNITIRKLENSDIDEVANTFNENEEYEKFQSQIDNKESDSLCKSKKRKSVYSDKGIIYIMRNMGYYKIGKAQIGSNRFGEYTKLPEEPIYIKKAVVKNHGNVELLLQETFKDCRLRDGSCEWFDLSDEELKEAINIIEMYEIKSA